MYYILRWNIRYFSMQSNNINLSDHKYNCFVLLQDYNKPLVIPVGSDSFQVLQWGHHTGNQNNIIAGDQ